MEFLHNNRIFFLTVWILIFCYTFHYFICGNLNYFLHSLMPPPFICILSQFLPIVCQIPLNTLNGALASLILNLNAHKMFFQIAPFLKVSFRSFIKL